MNSKVEILQQKGYNFLWIDGRLCMWDIPQEEADQKGIAIQAFGDVLVAGYGLGLVQKFLMKNREVNSVLTIESSKEVIEACKKVYGNISGKVEICDFFDFSSERNFDTIIGDLWTDKASTEDYLKFEEKARTLLKKDGKIIGWGMDYFEYLVKVKGIDPRKHPEKGLSSS